MKTRISQTILTCILATSHAFQTSNTARPTTALSMKQNENYSTTKSIGSTRKAFLASLITSSIIGTTASANAEEEGFESIAARAASMAQKVEKEEAIKEEQFKKAAADPRSAYDFSLPIKGEDVPFDKLIGQEFTETSVVLKGAEGEEDTTVTKRDAKVKAILVVNIKQDDPIARKNIPELISLASK